MPVFLIPQAENNTAPALGAGNIQQGYFADANQFPKAAVAPSSDGPNIRNQWDVLGFYIPGTIITFNTNGQPQASSAALQVSALVNSDFVWAESLTVPLTPAGTTSTIGNFLAAADLVNPVSLRAGNQLTFGFSISFNQTVLANWSIQLATAYSGVAAIGPTPATVRYRVTLLR